MCVTAQILGLYTFGGKVLTVLVHHLTVPKASPKSRYFGPGIWTWDCPTTTTVDLPADRVLAPGPAFHFVDPEFERFALSWLNG